jgi:hypothetical protein
MAFQTAFTAIPSVADNTKSVTVTVDRTPLKRYKLIIGKTAAVHNIAINFVLMEVE